MFLDVVNRNEVDNRTFFTIDVVRRQNTWVTLKTNRKYRKKEILKHEHYIYDLFTVTATTDGASFLFLLDTGQ